MLIVNIQKELGMMCGVDIIRKGMSHICLKLIVLILGGGMMRYELNFDEDKVNDVLVVGGASYDLKGCCDIMNEQQATISKLEEENEQLREINKELGDDLYNCRINKNIISEKLKLWQDAHKKYDIYSIKDFEELMKSIK